MKKLRERERSVTTTAAATATAVTALATYKNAPKIDYYETQTPILEVNVHNRRLFLLNLVECEYERYSIRIRMQQKDSAMRTVKCLQLDNTESLVGIVSMLTA